MEQEQWKDIEGYEGFYQISDYGRVRSFNNRWGKRKTGKLLSLSKSRWGYYQIDLSLNGIGKSFRVARLMALHFIPNLGNKEQVNHIDGNKTNDYYKNLEWATRSENILHAYRVLHLEMG